TRRSEDLVVAEPGFGRYAGDRRDRPRVRHAGRNQCHGSAVPDPISCREIVGTRVYGISVEQGERLYVAAYGDDLVGRVGKVAGRALRKPGRDRKRGVLECRVCFVYAGVENGDFHAGARITRTAERAPRLGRADKIESLVQFALQGR